MSSTHNDSEVYFAYSASLRIHGDDLDFERLTQTLGVEPTHRHMKGDRKRPHSQPWRDDAWHFQPAGDETRPLSDHLHALWDVLRPHVTFLKDLKRRHHVDVFCGYRSNSATAGFEVDHACLDLFVKLEIPFGVSVVII